MYKRINRLSDSFREKSAAKLGKEKATLESVRLLRQEAGRRIERMIAEVWEWKLKMLSWTM